MNEKFLIVVNTTSGKRFKKFLISVGKKLAMSQKRADVDLVWQSISTNKKVF